jgi:hypothetical protein
MHMPDAAHVATDQDSSFCGTEGGNGVRIQGDSAATSLQEYEQGQDTEKTGGAPCWASGTQANTVGAASHSVVSRRRAPTKFNAGRRDRSPALPKMADAAANSNLGESKTVAA